MQERKKKIKEDRKLGKREIYCRNIEKDREKARYIDRKKKRANNIKKYQWLLSA